MQDKFKPQDMPLVLDATFALALHAYALVLKDNVPEGFHIRDVLMQRFLNQGFDPVRSEKVSDIINEIIVRLIKDAQKNLNEN